MRPSSPFPQGLAERITRFCRECARDDQLVELMTEAGAENLLTEVTTLVMREPSDPAALAAALDAIEQVLAGLGIHGLTSPNREWRPLPGVAAPPPGLSVWVCPVRRCMRAETVPADCGLSRARLTETSIPR
jgi:hypothetical protein